MVYTWNYALFLFNLLVMQGRSFYRTNIFSTKLQWKYQGWDNMLISRFNTIRILGCWFDIFIAIFKYCDPILQYIAIFFFNRYDIVFVVFFVWHSFSCFLVNVLIRVWFWCFLTIRVCWRIKIKKCLQKIIRNKYFRESFFLSHP